MRGVKGSSSKYCERHGEEKTYWHPSSGRVAGGRWECSACRSERATQYYAANRKEIAEYGYQYYRENQERKRAWGKEKISVGPYTVTRARAGRWWRAFRLRPEDVLEIYLSQDKRCAFGGESLAWEAIYIDHKHGHPECKKTARGEEYGCPKETIRGLTCEYHNRMEGFFQENPKAYMDIPCWHAKYNGGQVPCHCEE